MRHKFFALFRSSLAATHARHASTSTPALAHGGGPNYFPGLSRKTSAAVTHHHAGPLTGLGARRHSLTEADALAARRYAQPSPSRQPCAPGVYVVEGGPAVATADFWPARASVTDPDWVQQPR